MNGLINKLKQTHLYTRQLNKKQKGIFTFNVVRERKGETSKAIRVTDDGGGGCITFKLCTWCIKQYK